MNIAIDAMGGDHTPDVAVRGAIEAAKEWTDVELILVGDEARLRPLLQGAPGNVHIQHASETIDAEDEPVRAVRRKKDSSMVVAGTLVKQKQAAAMISAGNTGALMTTGLLIVGRIPGIERPALAPILPSASAAGMLALDMGANMDSSAQHLLQYAIMGSIYRARVDGIERPRVGLLNVGSEPGKGNELTKAAYPLLEGAPIHFVGNVEARDVLKGACDVLVCDGFAGNIMLKGLEGAASFIFSALRTEFTRSTLTKLAAAILKPGLSAFRKRLDYTEYGAAPLLGIDGLCLKCHGSSDAKSFKNAVRQARLAIKNELVQAMSDEFSKWEAGDAQ